MAGLYIHIPFCKSRCIYCGFYSTTRYDVCQQYVDALCKEMELQRTYLQEPPETIYIGGGTPSLLSTEMLRQIFLAAGAVEAKETTIECNPDDITPEFAKALSTLPVNRVSMGAQTFDDTRLKFIRRRHNSHDISNAVHLLRDAGITNISIDLMYGFPGETTEQWHDDISRALALRPEHLSAYCLTYEEDTPLYDMLQRGKVRENDEETCRKMYENLADTLASAGYEHYEISNFALPGRRSLHNSNYWNDVPYLGVGAAAHSYNRKSRQWNVADINEYIESIGRGVIPMRKETLDKDTRYNDMVMLSLRTREGLSLDKLTAYFGRDYRLFCMETARKYIESGLLETTADNRLRLTREGVFVSDMIMSDMMKVDSL